MNEQLINTTTSGTQYQQTHVLLDNGHLIAWVSTDHNAIYGQQFDDAFQKKGEEILLLQGEASISAPRSPQLFNTSSGFGLMFRPSDGNIYIKLFSLLGEELTSHKRVNKDAISNMQSDAQWGVVEINDGYMVVWSGNDGGLQHEDIFAQKIDQGLERTGERFTLSARADHSKFNPCIYKDNDGFVVAWASRPQIQDGVFASRICVRRYDDQGDPMGEYVEINPNDDYASAARFVQINASKNGYIVLWKAGYTNAWALEVDMSLQPLSDNSTEIVSGSAVTLKYVQGFDEEFATVGYASSGQNVVMQRYHISGEPIEDSFIVNDDPNEEFYDDGGTLWAVPGGYVAIWNSVKLGENYEIYAKRLLYGSQEESSTVSIPVDNHMRFTAFKTDVNNIVQDIQDIKDIRDKVDNWINQGVDLAVATGPLNQQQQEWTSYLEDRLEVLKTAFLELKTHDDRIASSGLVTFDPDVYSSLTLSSKAEYLCSLYEHLHSNLHEDIGKLSEIGASIDGFRDLGVQLGDARQVVDDQKATLEAALQETSKRFDDIRTNLESKKAQVTVDGDS